MAWYSLLPSYLAVVETWIIRTAIFCAVFSIAPWLLALLADILLYLFRQTWYWIPVWGGRAQGRSRPTAPSLDITRRRGLSLADMMGNGDLKRISEEGLRRRHGRDTSSNTFDDDGGSESPDSADVILTTDLSEMRY